MRWPHYRRTIGLVAGFILLSVAAVKAVDKHDYAQPGWGTTAGFEADGDTITTGSVSCGNGSATLVRGAVVDRSRRRLRVQNTNQTFTLNLGSSTVAASDLWTIGVSTSATNFFDTYNSGAIYCSGNGSAVTLQWLEEDAASDVSGQQ